MDTLAWIIVGLWVFSILAAVAVGWLLRGDVTVEARQDDRPYIHVDWELDR